MNELMKIPAFKAYFRFGIFLEKSAFGLLWAIPASSVELRPMRLGTPFIHVAMIK